MWCIKGRHGKKKKKKRRKKIKIKINLTNRNVTIITLARAAIQTNAVQLNTIIASEEVLNKTSRRNTVFQKRKEFLL
jgi:hypothetical protein